MGLQVLGYSVLWAGISGMRWDELVPLVHSMTKLLWNSKNGANTLWWK